jgi:integrase
MKANPASKPGPKGKGIFHIVEFSNAAGTTSYRVTGWKFDGTRVRQNFKTHPEALAKLQQLEIEAANLTEAARPVITRLTPEQAAEAEVAYAQLGGKPMLTAIRYFLDNYRNPLKPKTVEAAFVEFIAEKKRSNLRPDSIRNLEAKCRALKDTYGRKLCADLSLDTLKALVFTEKRGPVAKDNVRRALNGFFAWAADAGYVAENPMAKIKRIETDDADPVILTITQAQKLMDSARAYKDGALVPFVALALFAGLRPDKELARITWDDIDLKAETITLSGKVAKMRGKRLVEAVRLPSGEKDKDGKEILRPSNLFQWLASHAEKKTPIKGSGWRKQFDAVKLAAGFGTPDEADEKRKDLTPWPQDVLRHTAISYHYAHCQHEGKTAQWAGNSPDIVHKKYKGLVKPENVAKFWTITPEAAKNVIPLKITAA